MREVELTSNYGLFIFHDFMAILRKGLSDVRGTKTKREYSAFLHATKVYLFVITNSTRKITIQIPTISCDKDFE